MYLLLGFIFAGLFVFLTFKGKNKYIIDLTNKRQKVTGDVIFLYFAFVLSSLFFYPVYILGISAHLFTKWAVKFVEKLKEER